MSNHAPTRTLRRLWIAVLVSCGLSLGSVTACLLLLLAPSQQEFHIASPGEPPRFILASQVPNAPFGGEVLPRTVPPDTAGMLFLDSLGNEVGGIAVGGDADSAHAMIALDYRDVPIEAIRMIRRSNGDEQAAEITILDNPSRPIALAQLAEELRSQEPGPQAQLLQDQMTQRIRLGVEKHDAALEFHDSRGRLRLALGVDATGNPYLASVDEGGTHTSLLR